MITYRTAQEWAARLLEKELEDSDEREAGLGATQNGHTNQVHRVRDLQLLYDYHSKAIFQRIRGDAIFGDPSVR